MPWMVDCLIVYRRYSNGSSMKFYINSSLVWLGTSVTFPTGQVGLTMYRKAGTTSNYFYMDWAKLTIISPDELFFDDPFEVIIQGIELPGGDITHSPLFPLFET